MHWGNRSGRWIRALRGLWGGLAVAVVMSAAGTAGSVAFHGWWHHTIAAQNEDRLDRSVASRSTRISDNLTRYVDALRAAGAFVQAAAGGDQFERFVQGMQVQNRYVGMQALALQVPQAGPRAVVVYQHSLGPVSSAVGDDRRAYPGVAAVLDGSRDSGEPALVPSPIDAGVYWLFLPVYRSPGNATAAARRAGLLGWVSAQIDADRFLSESLSGIAAGTAGVQLVDPGLRRPIAADPDGFQAAGRYARSVDLPLAGRMWRLNLAPLPGSILIQDANPTAAIGLIGGISLSVLLAATTIMIITQARTTRALRTANRRSADMVAMLSHDARQPLTTIINYSELVLEDWQETGGEADHDVSASLHRVIGAAHRLNDLVDDVLETARLDAIPTHNARPVLVERIVVEAVSDSGAPGMVIDTTAVQAVWAHTDPTHLRQIIANLIGNALKYGAPPVTIAARRSGGHVTIEVRDAGPGVPPDFVDRLFDRFTRAGAAGTGFGLYIVQRLAEANGGRITYRPGEPAGACFTLTLPGATAAEPFAPTSRSPRRTGAR